MTRTIGQILADRATDAVARLATLLQRERLTESELEEIRPLRKILNIKSLAAKGILVASLAVTSGCAVLDRNGFAFHSEIGVTATEQRTVQTVSRKASLTKPLICEFFPQRCEMVGVQNDK